MATNVFDLHELFAAPLVALLEADAAAAERFAGFLQQYGFDANGELRKFVFHYARTNAAGESENVEVSIPAVSLIPLPALQVRDAQFRFGVRIVDGQRAATGTPSRIALGSAPAVVAAPAPLALRASFARGGGEPSASTDATINATVNVAQADVPAGLAALLATLHDANHAEVR